MRRETKRLVTLADVVVGREAEDKLRVRRAGFVGAVQEGVQREEGGGQEVCGG